LGYEKTALRAFIFVGVGNEKCMADYVAQLLPSLFFSLTANNFATKWGAAAGILVGVPVVTYLTVTGSRCAPCSRSWARWATSTSAS
jgi:hypothetical protein